jgi:microcystin-dependent protein
MSDIALLKIEDLTSLLELLPSLITIASDGSGNTKKFTLSQLRDWLLTNPNLVNPTASTPSTADNSTKIATTEYVKNNLSGLGLAQATASAYGTVRTNITDPVPVVYLKAEIDTFNSSIRSILTGGTGASTDIGARTNLSAAKSGSNADITELTILGTIPAIIQNALNTIEPIGVVKAFAGNTIPNGYLECNGQAVSRTVYSLLFSAIGTIHGVGNGSTTFNVPNITDKDIVGVSVTKPLGSTGGIANKTLAIGEIPSHNHGGFSGATDRSIDHLHSASSSLGGSHSHNIGMPYNTNTQVGGTQVRATSSGATFGLATDLAGDHTHVINVGAADRSLDHLHSIAAQGGGTAFSIQNPYIALKHIIKF